MDQFHLLPRITFRQLEVLRAVYRERSFAHAAIDLHGSRANVKRICHDLENILGGKLFQTGEKGELLPTPFAEALMGQLGPLVRAIRKLEDSVESLHKAGRVLRLAATPELFEGAWFTGFLRRFRTKCPFRVCCLMLDERRFRTALLNAECDVFLGAGITPSDKLDFIDLGSVPWKFLTRDESFDTNSPRGLTGRDWYLAEIGDSEVHEAVMEELRARGATGGRSAASLLWRSWLEHPDALPKASVLVIPDVASACAPSTLWPNHRFGAYLRRNHPYSELKSLLEETIDHGI